jgi:hypothetical protein
MTKKTESQLIRDSYPNKECPDCSEPIPKNVTAGQECSNCGHVFCVPTDND